METNKKRCVKCEDAKSGGGLFMCDGCQQMFCTRHVSEHRQELGIRLEYVAQEYDLVQQESSQITLDKSILAKVDSWEKDSIGKIRRLAENIRADLYESYQISNERIKNECSELGKSIRMGRDRDDYSEPDLIKWNQLLSNLKTQIESLNKIDIVEDKQSSISLIKIENNVQRSTNTLQKRSIVDIPDRPNEIANRTRVTPTDVPHSDRSSNWRRHRRGDGNTDTARPAECKQQ